MRRNITIALSVLMVFTFIFVAMQGMAIGAEEDRLVREVSLITRPKASSPDEFETITILAEAMEKVGIRATVEVMPWEQMADVVWYDREAWDLTGWQMTARPERLDPDEFTYNLFHSSTAETGYNFIGYKNPEYDRVAEEQRVTVDKEKRRELIYKSQEIIAEDVGYIFSVNPLVNIVYNNEVFAADSIKEMAGLGIKNFWTYINAEPISEQQDFILNSNDTVQAINPLYISGSVDSWITELVWDRVMRMGQDGLPTPWAAESVEWLDNTTVEVVMRDDMTWHDGKPVTVEDVKFSFEVPKTGEAPMYKPFVDIIDEIEITGESTLVFNLKEPWAAFETASLAKLNIIPKHIWEPIIEDLKDKPENAESYQADVPIGSGPFKFSNWKFSEEVVLEANEDHFQAPKVNHWIARFIPNMEATLGMIQNGELNFLATYLGDNQLLQQRVEESPHLTMVSSIDLGFRFLAPNHRVKPFSDKAFRRAVASLADRELFAGLVWKGFAVPSSSVISPALEYWHNPDVNYPEAGIMEARKTLEEAGYEWDSQGRLLYPAE
ncbi:MAG TPA: ABC transporter substrate-binding protein [Halanaerobiales bacterium]|nr:ABC transporter substrate-binding protein [Halanaerobiales bacterium]